MLLFSHQENKQNKPLGLALLWLLPHLCAPENQLHWVLFRHLRAPWACPDWLLPARHLRAALTPTPSAPGSGARTCPVYTRRTDLGGAFCP